MAIDWTPARLEVDLNYKSKDIVLASEWNNLWKETRLQGNNNTDGIVLLIEIVDGNVTHLTNLDNLFSDLESKVTAHTGNTDIHVTSEQKTAWTAKYDKPSGGIPKSDLASTVQSSLDKADTALQQHQDISALTAHVANNNIHVTVDNKTAWNAKYDKPADGIPKTDLASAVQTSLGKADTALQEHQDISDLRNHVANNNVHVTTDDKTAWNAKYDKPSSGIPKTDLASDVQTSLEKADTALQQHQDISALTNHVANNDIHVTTDEKTAWDAKPEVFNIYVSQNRGTGAYYADKTFDEILAAYNAGNILKISLSGSGGIFDSYLASGDRFKFYVPDYRSRVLITPSTITVEDAPMYVPVTNTSDVGKVLTVGSSKTPVWAEATSSGGKSAYTYAVEGGYTLTESDFTTDLGNLHNLPTHISNTNLHIDSAERTAWNAKAEVFNINFTSNPETMTLTADKTIEEAKNAYLAGNVLQAIVDTAYIGSLIQAAYSEADDVFVVSFRVNNGYNSIEITFSPNGIQYSQYLGIAPDPYFSAEGSYLALNEYKDPVWTEDTKAEASDLTAHTGNADIHVTASQKTTWSGKYSKPSAGIPKTDLASDVQNSLNAVADKSNKPTFSQYTILTSGWSSGVYSFESDFPSATYDIEIELDSTATESQVEAWSSAKVTSVFGTNTMKALGDVPTVDIPVIVKKVVK